MPRARARNEGSVYFDKRRQKWTAQLYMDGSKRIRTAPNEQAAARLLAKMRKARDEGRDITTLTVAAFLTDWMERREADGGRVNTNRTRRSYVTAHLIPRLGHIRLEALTPQHVEGLTRAVLAAGLSGRTAAHCRTILGGALADAERWGLVERNAARLARPPEVTAIERVPLTAAEIAKLHTALAQDDWRGVYALAYTLGLREGESLALRWQDVDLEGRTLRIAQTVRRIKGGADVYEPPKSRASRRPLPLTDELARVLRWTRARQAEARLRAGTMWAVSDLVFTDALGRGLPPASVLRHLKDVEAIAGVPQVTVHDLRHSANSVMAEAGIPSEVRAAILGHSSARINEDVYTHFMAETLRAAVEAGEGARASR